MITCPDLESKAPSNDLLQAWPHKFIYPKVCCVQLSQGVCLVLPPFSVMRGEILGPSLFNQFPHVHIQGFGNKKENKILWQCVNYWMLWLERNTCMFKSVFPLLICFWNRV